MTHRRVAAGVVRPALVVALLAGSACSNEEPRTPVVAEATLTVVTRSGDVEFDVRIAETPDARATGLMGVRTLAPDAGMVFLFDAPTDGAFWMKGTLLPLSIAFWDADGRIVAMLDMTPCRAEPCPLYSPGHEYVAALEVNRGALSDRGVRIGDLVRLQRSDPTFRD
ncbi:hypothetical protein BH20ACT24_BH20ACT24_16660 [soil metagenome]